jgi:hypothetical protein
MSRLDVHECRRCPRTATLMCDTCRNNFCDKHCEKDYADDISVRNTHICDGCREERDGEELENELADELSHDSDEDETAP